ncbi:hypothetical protein VCR29J2_410104 [Vibrio coralliirubri]|nr:hypothetical protein VCR29J2_410104 [Vibrio coralliirubri]
MLAESLHYIYSLKVSAVSNNCKADGSIMDYVIISGLRTSLVASSNRYQSHAPM